MCSARLFKVLCLFRSSPNGNPFVILISLGFKYLLALQVLHRQDILNCLKGSGSCGYHTQQREFNAGKPPTSGRSVVWGQGQSDTLERRPSAGGPPSRLSADRRQMIQNCILQIKYYLCIHVMRLHKSLNVSMCVFQFRQQAYKGVSTPRQQCSDWLVLLGSQSFGFFFFFFDVRIQTWLC